MKILITYFSLTGNTKWLAQEIGNQLEEVSYHQIVLEDSHPAKGFWAAFWYGFKSIFNRPMPIKPDSLDLSIYDIVLIGTPIWTDNVPPPVRMFLQRHQYAFSRVSLGLFATYGGNYKHFIELLQQQLPDKKLKGSLIISNATKDWKRHCIGPILDFLTKILNKNIWISSH